MGKNVQTHYDEGQRDGARGIYVGTLFSGRNRDEHSAYKLGYESGKKNRHSTFVDTGHSPDQESKKVSNESLRSSQSIGSSDLDLDGIIGIVAAIGGFLGACAGALHSIEIGASTGWFFAYTLFGAWVGGMLFWVIAKYFLVLIAIFALAGILKACGAS